MSQRRTEEALHGDTLPLLSLEESVHAGSATARSDTSFLLHVPTPSPSPLAGLSTMLPSTHIDSYPSPAMVDNIHPSVPGYRTLTTRDATQPSNTLKIALIAGITTPISLFILWAICLKLYRIRYKKRHMSNSSDVESQPNKEGSQEELTTTSSSDTAAPEEASPPRRPRARTQPTGTINGSEQRHPRDSVAEHFDIALDMHRASLLKESPSPNVSSPHLPLYGNPYAHPALISRVASTSGTTIARGATPTSLLTGSPRSSYYSTPAPTPSKLLPYPSWKPPVPAPEGTEALVVAAFTPSMHDELTLVPGEKVKVVAEFDDGWILCAKTDTGRQGVVPCECLDPSAFDNIRSASPGTGSLHHKP
jgi:hypothetical protein